MNLNAQKTHKSYIRRKRCLHESSRIIQNTMRAITSSLGRPMSDAELLEFSTTKAREIEASCWSPRLKLSDKEYQKKTEEKTQQLCEILIRQSNLPMIQPPGCFNTGNFYSTSYAPPNPYVFQNNNFSQNQNINPSSNFQNNIQNPPMYNQQNHDLNSFQVQQPSVISQAPVNNTTFHNTNPNFFNYGSQNINEYNSGSNITNNNNKTMNINQNMNTITNMNMMNRIPSSNEANHPTMQKNILRNEKNDFNAPDFGIEEQDGQNSFDNSPEMDFPDITINSRDKYRQPQLQMQETSTESQNSYNNSRRNFSPSSTTIPTSDYSQISTEPSMELNEQQTTHKGQFSQKKTSLRGNKSMNKNLPIQPQQSPIQSPSIPQQQKQQMIQIQQQQQQMMQIQNQQQQMIQFQQQQMNQIQQQQQQITQLQQNQQQPMMQIQQQTFSPIQQQQSFGNQGFSNQNSGFQLSLNQSQQQQQQQQMRQNNQQQMPNSPMMPMQMEFSNQSFMQSGQQIPPKPQQQHQMPQFNLMQYSNSNSELNGIETNQDDDDDDQMGWNENKQYKHFFGD